MKTTININGTTLELQRGVVHRVENPDDGTYLDILPLDQYETGLFCGDLNEEPVAPWVGEVNGEPVTIPWLCAKRVQHEERLITRRQQFAAFWDAYLAAPGGGSPFSPGSQELIKMPFHVPVRWGPFPDTAVTKAGGSSRLWVNRCPPALLAMTGNTQDIEAPWRWLDEQLGRAVHAYRVVNGRLVVWDPDDDPTWNLSAPYGAKVGGFRDGEGPQLQTGWPACDWQHFALQTTPIAAVTGSRMAALHSIMHWNAAVSGIDKEDHNGARGVGHMLREGAQLYGLGYKSAVRGLDRTLGVLAERTADSNGVIWDDRGVPSDGPGHVLPSDGDVVATAALLGVERQQVARSSSAFELGVLACGLTNVQTFGSHDVTEQMLLARKSFLALTRPAWDRLHGKGVIQPKVMWEDISRCSRLAPANTPVADLGHNADGDGSEDVLARYTEAGMRALRHHLGPDAEFDALIERVASLRGVRAPLVTLETWF